MLIGDQMSPIIPSYITLIVNINIPMPRIGYSYFQRKLVKKFLKVMHYAEQPKCLDSQIMHSIILIILTEVMASHYFYKYTT